MLQANPLQHVLTAGYQAHLLPSRIRPGQTPGCGQVSHAPDVLTVKYDVHTIQSTSLRKERRPLHS